MRKLIATALLALAIAGCNGHQYETTCPTPTEDSAVTCNLNPTARYEYDRGVWHTTTRESAPTGAEVLAFDPDQD